MKEEKFELSRFRCMTCKHDVMQWDREPCCSCTLENSHYEPDEQAAKADAGKPELSLVPPEIIYAIERVRRYGVEKYKDPDNWRHVSVKRYWDAVLRHVLAAWYSPEAVDDESGLKHIDHIACNLAFIMELMKDETTE